MILFHGTSDDKRVEIMQAGFSFEKQEENEKRWGPGIYFTYTQEESRDLGSAVIAAELKNDDAIIHMTQSQMEELEFRLFLSGQTMEEYFTELGYVGVEITMEDNSKMVIIYDINSIKIRGWKQIERF